MKINLRLNLKQSKHALLILIRYGLFGIIAILILFDLYFVYSHIPELNSTDVSTASGQNEINETIFDDIVNDTAQRLQSPYEEVENILDPFR